METNFKVDVPSFALGYSAGRKKGGGGAELNIHYSLDTPPTNTSMLWVKTKEPSKVTIKPNADDFQYVDNLQYNTSFNILGGAKGCCASYNDHVYFIGGTSGYNTKPTDGVCDFYYYEYSGGGYWTNTNGKVKLPQYRACVCCAAYDENIYVFGGAYSNYNNSNAIYVVDVVANGSYSYSQKLPATLVNACCARVGDYTYIFGGKTTSLSANTGRTNKIIRFTPTGEAIGYIEETLHEATQNMCCAANGEKIYLFGGDNEAGNILDTIYCFDPATEKLELLETRLPIAITGAACAALGDYIYVYGGCTDFTTPSYNYDIYRFNVKSHKIDKSGASREVGPYASQMGVARGIILIGGGAGYYPSGYGVGGTVEIKGHTYAPREDFELHKNEMLVVSDQHNNVFTALKAGDTKIDTGVLAVFKGNSDNVDEMQEAALYKDGEWKPI